MAQCSEGPGVRGRWAHGQIRSDRSLPQPAQSINLHLAWESTPAWLPPVMGQPGRPVRKGGCPTRRSDPGRVQRLGLEWGLTQRALSRGSRNGGQGRGRQMLWGWGGQEGRPKKRHSSVESPGLPSHFYFGRDRGHGGCPPLGKTVQGDRRDLASPASGSQEEDRECGGGAGRMPLRIWGGSSRVPLPLPFLVLVEPQVRPAREVVSLLCLCLTPDVLN